MRARISLSLWSFLATYLSRSKRKQETFERRAGVMLLRRCSVKCPTEAPYRGPASRPALWLIVDYLERVVNIPHSPCWQGLSLGHKLSICNRMIIHNLQSQVKLRLSNCIGFIVHTSGQCVGNIIDQQIELKQFQAAIDQRDKQSIVQGTLHYITVW